ncbi:MAG: hypothetical protein ACRD20_19395 [Terriglobales bacterium]
MGNEAEKNQRNPGQQEGNPGNQADPNKKNPSHSGEQSHNPQDPTTKKPGQDTGSTDRPGREGSDDVEKRRAS